MIVTDLENLPQQVGMTDGLAKAIAFLRDAQGQSLADGRSLFSLAPDLEYEERVTLPLRAGDCTFHNGRCAHMANANTTDVPRVALSVIMMGRDTRFRDKPHPCTDGKGFKPGQIIEGDEFPNV